MNTKKQKKRITMTKSKPKFFKQLEQRSQEWFDTRKWVATGSTMDRATWSKAVQGTLSYELVSDRVIDDSVTPEWFEFDNPHLQEKINLWLALRSQEVLDRWSELEKYTYSWYHNNIDSRLEEVWFVKLNDYVGCSPDGLIRAWRDYIGAVEFKCPLGKNFLTYIIDWWAPKNHKAQLLNYFVCIPTLQYVDYVVYHPWSPKHIWCFHIYKYTREELREDIEKATIKLDEFIGMMQDMENNLSIKYPKNDMEIEKDMWYNPKNVAAFLWLHQRTVQDKCRMWEIKCANISKAGAKRPTYRIKWEHILEFLQ